MPNVQSTPGLLLNHQTLSAFIRSVADLLRGDYKQSDYGKVILPFTVFRAVVICVGLLEKSRSLPE
jgi:type I restriction-modification system DNA methylase subunit